MNRLYISPDNSDVIYSDRQAGIETFGCECKKSGEWIYPKSLGECHFPTDCFDEIDCNIHSSGPMPQPKEVARILKQKGMATIRYFNDCDAKIDQVIMERLLTATGLLVVDSTRDDRNAIIFTVAKPLQRRASILLPGGMGDCWWTIVKMQSFLEQNGVYIPDIYVAYDINRVSHGYTNVHKRSFAFLEMFPFLHSTGLTIALGIDPERREIFRAAYADDGETIFRNILGCDWFMGFNGPLHHGRTLKQIHPELECDWNPPMFVSLEQEEFKRSCVENYGDYALLYFSTVGTYQYWIEQFQPTEIIRAINAVAESGHVPIFAGAEWDRDGDELLSDIVRNVPGAVDLRGATTLQQLFGLMQGASIVAGWPGGIIIMAAGLGKKTLAVWNKFYKCEHWWNVCSPATHNTTYFVENTDGMNADRLVGKITEIISG